MSQPSPLPAVDSWLVMNLELIAFLVDPEAALEQNWWAALAGQNVETTRKRHERSDIGEFQGRTLRLSIDALRARWSIGPQIEVSAAEGMASGPFIGPFPPVRDSFEALMIEWFSNHCPEINRLTFAAKLVHQTENREQSYSVLDRYLDSVRVAPDSSEFQYRINRRRASSTGIPNLAINRLSTWSAVTFDFALHVGIAGAGASSEREYKQQYTGALLQLDINTNQEFAGPLPRERLVDIWRELVRLGSEIAELGDIP